jgi:hypothetical protein
MYVFDISKWPNLFYARLTLWISVCPGHWVSVMWMNQTKKYLESLSHSLPTLLVDEAHTPNKKLRDRQTRKGPRNACITRPPLSAVNADLMCVHGGLSVARAAKRTTVDIRVWRLIRKYFPVAADYPCWKSSECVLCVEAAHESLVTQRDRKKTELARRSASYLPELLIPMAERKSGVPRQCTRLWVDQFLLETDVLLAPTAVAGTHQLVGYPLISGLYNLVPRQWLRQYRRYLRDVDAARPPLLDCSGLLCDTHGLLVVPPHVEEYLVGIRVGLLSNLMDYQGEVVEIVSADEWDVLQDTCRGCSDFNVRFSLQGQDISWNIGLCHSCDPFNYGPVVATVGSSTRRATTRAQVVVL